MNHSDVSMPLATDVMDRLRGLGEATLGGGLMTLSYWGEVLDRVVGGAHVVAAICGAVIGIHGVWRIGRMRFGSSRRQDDQ